MRVRTSDRNPGVRGAMSGAVRAVVVVLVLLAAPSSLRAGGLEDLQALLQKTRAQVEQFARNLSSIRYEESVVQEKLKQNGKIAYKQEIAFDSLILIRFNHGELGVEESRFLERQPARGDRRPFLQTKGFSILAMVFHPYYEESFQFSRLDNEMLDGTLLARLRFEYISGKPTPVLYQIIGGDRPISLSGVAWVDPGSGIIHRIDADLTPSLADLGLKSLRAELRYGQVTLADDPQPRWLPVTATIDLETPKQHWRNIHRFSNYRHYSVQTRIESVTNTP
jgi:hypothetical protein